jgi:hypothetical protein
MASWHPGEASWSVDEIPYQAVVRERVISDTLLFYLITAASFIEITSDVYTRNLVEFMRHDREVVEWLERSWEHEEVQHGIALKRYVQTAWPDFDWDAAYRHFLAEFSCLCSVDQLARSPALEMAARCVVETGTSTFYRMLAASSHEPVLTQIASKISFDEVRHYKHFYRYFRRFRENERLGRGAVLHMLWKRVGEIDAEDARCAFKHAFIGRNPGTEFDERYYVIFRDRLRPLARQYFPHQMAMSMLLQPLELNNGLKRMVVPTIASATRLLLLAGAKWNAKGGRGELWSD